MKALREWIGSIIGDIVMNIDEDCLLKVLHKCGSHLSQSQSSMQLIREFFDHAFTFPAHEIVNWDRLYQDPSECEIVACLVIIGAMQTQAAKKFIEAALSLSEEIQGEIYAIIQSPVTKVHNEEIITREELLKALQLENPAKSDNPRTPEKRSSTANSENRRALDEGDVGLHSFITSTPVNECKNSRQSFQPNEDAFKQALPRPNSLKVSVLMPPPAAPPPQRCPKISNTEADKAQPPASPLTPLKTLVESPHWNTKPDEDNGLTYKVRLHEAEQRARTAELGLARAEAEREDAEAVIVELRGQISEVLKRAQTAEAEAARLRREAVQLRDQRDELVEAKSELVLQTERIKVLEERLAESQASAASAKEWENATKELERQLNDRDTRISALLEKLSENKNRKMSSVEIETLHLRLKEAESRLAEELRCREALEQDVRSQQSVVQQMQIDKRIAEKRSHSQQQNEQLESMRHFGDGDGLHPEASFDVSMVAITSDLPSVRTHGENLGSVFHRELELARSQIQSLEKQLSEATSHSKDTDIVVEQLREFVAKLRSEHIDLEAALVLAQEAQAAAETARDHLAEDLGTLKARLDYDFTSAGLLTPEAVSFADALINVLSKRDEEVKAFVENLKARGSIEKVDVEIQTEAEEVEPAPPSIEVSIQTDREELEIIESPVMDQLDRLNEELVQTSADLITAKEEVSHLKEKLATIEERYREEMALSARAHHLCELNEQEARRFHVLGERYRAAIMSFLSRLENRGLIELRGLLEHDASSDGVTSTSFEIAQELNSVCSQLVLGGERLNDMRKENSRLKEEICRLRERLKKNRTLEDKIRHLTENSEYLELEMQRLIQRQKLPTRDVQQNRKERQRHSLTARPAIEDAVDTDEDSVAYTDLSQVSSRPPYSPLSDNLRNRGHIAIDNEESSAAPIVSGNVASTHKPASQPVNGRGRKVRGQASSPPSSLPVHDDASHIQSVASLCGGSSEPPPTMSNMPQTYPAAHHGNTRNHAAKSTANHQPERPEDMYARLAELRRRNDLQPFHLRTNYPVETQLQSPNQLLSLLQTIHQNGLEKQRSESEVGSAATSDSPAPAGFPQPPKGLQSVSEVLLTGASGIVGADKLDLTATRARPTESILKMPTNKEDDCAKNFTEEREIASRFRSQPNPPPLAVKKESLAFEVEFSPPHSRRRAPPEALSRRNGAKSSELNDASNRVNAGSVFKVPSNPSTSKAPAKGWATPAAIAASNSRRPLKEASGKVNRRT